MAYSNDPFGTGRPQSYLSVINILIGINALIFALGYIPVIFMQEHLHLREVFQYYGALWPYGHQLFGFWQYFTYMFLHGGGAHIFLNMLILWMFGTEIEQMWGSRRFLFYYLVCGLGAGIVHSVVTYFMHDPGPTVGASGAIMGVMIAFGMIFPNRMLLVMFFLPMRAKYAILLFAALDLYNGVAGSDHIAHFAHLGGALVGFILLKIGGTASLGGIFDRFSKTPRAPLIPPSRTPPARVIEANFRDVQPTHRAPEQLNLGADRERIDAILDKISKTGYQNLSEEEKALLLEVSRRIR